MAFINISFLTSASCFTLDLTGVDTCVYILITTNSAQFRDMNHLTYILGPYWTSERATELPPFPTRTCPRRAVSVQAKRTPLGKEKPRGTSRTRGKARWGQRRRLQTLT